MRDFFRGLRVLVWASFRCAPGLATLAFAFEPLGQLIQAFSALFLKQIIAGAQAHDAARVEHAAVWLFASAGIGYVLNLSGWRLRTQLLERTGAWLDERIMNMSASLTGLEHHERAEFHDRMARLDGPNLGNALFGLIPGGATVVRLVVVAGLLATIHPALVLLPLFGLPAVWIGTRAEKVFERAWEESAEHGRLADHLYKLSISAASAKELRVFGLDEEVRARHRSEREVRERLFEKAGLRTAGWRAGGWAIYATGYVAAIGLVAVRAASGRASLAEVVLAVTLAGQVNGLVSTIAGELESMLHRMKVAGHFVWLEDLVRADRAASGAPPSALREGIVFEDVSFTYPGTETPVLEGVNLRIPAGARVAIVGDNGAGKTTLVKLLCRFYNATSGRITVDGVDLSSFDAAAWRARLSGGFQDYCRFELIARETVGVGELSLIDDEPAVVGALGRAGAPDLPATLNAGLETQLGKTFDGGVDLSMGQWQKLALGRAFMRARPLLLVLDEPTASLDAKTEHALFQRYAEAARERAADGAITLLVSHRFSTVRSADLIIVVEGGRVREVGSHQELMARAGLYAELFTLQASAYR